MSNNSLKVGLAQIAPVWLNKKLTTEKVVEYINKAASQQCELVAFGEALLPGYPFWPELTNGAEFNSAIQKELHAHYMQEAVNIELGELDDVKAACKNGNIACVLGTIEKASNRGAHSLYCSCVYIDQKGDVQSVHRKLVPTYDERLNWAIGDGNGLRVHPLGPFTVGALNCWENWMPLVRTSLHAQGEDLHVAIWPGSQRNTQDITRFMAMEGRSYILSVSGLMTKEHITSDLPHADLILKNAPDHLTDGGSCLAAPDGSWVIEPHLHEEVLLTAEIDHKKVREERHNLDVSGHYSRPDVTQLTVNRKRQATAEFEE